MLRGFCATINLSLVVTTLLEGEGMFRRLSWDVELPEGSGKSNSWGARNKKFIMVRETGDYYQ